MTLYMTLIIALILFYKIIIPNKFLIQAVMTQANILKYMKLIG